MCVFLDSGLVGRWEGGREGVSYLTDHHVAVECAFAKSFFGLLDVWSDLGDHGMSERDVGYEVAIHDIDV